MVEKVSIVIRRVALDKPIFFDRKTTCNNWKNNILVFCFDVVGGGRKKKKKNKKKKIEVWCQLLIQEGLYEVAAC